MPVVTTSNFIACKTLDEFATSMRAAFKNNAAIEMALVDAGECFLFPQGTGVRVKAANAAADDPKVACVFVDAHPQCMWLPTNVLKDAD